MSINKVISRGERENEDDVFVNLQRRLLIKQMMPPYIRIIIMIITIMQNKIATDVSMN